jgi:hypothetical protein
MRKTLFLLMFAMVLIAMPSAFGIPTGTVTIVSYSCPSNNSYLGTAEVSWSISSDAVTPGLWVQYYPVGGGSQVFSEMSAGYSGTDYPNWLSYGQYYNFEAWDTSSSDYYLLAYKTVQC